MKTARQALQVVGYHALSVIVAARVKWGTMSLDEGIAILDARLECILKGGN